MKTIIAAFDCLPHLAGQLPGDFSALRMEPFSSLLTAAWLYLEQYLPLKRIQFVLFNE